jgi:plasmid stabilization system protein ParE
MAYRVDLTERAARDLIRIYRTINAENSAQAHAWFNGLERVIVSLRENPARGTIIPEDVNLRHVLYGRTRKPLSDHPCGPRARAAVQFAPRPSSSRSAAANACGSTMRPWRS